MNQRIYSIKFSLIALAIGTIGACGQAYLLYHELVDCLPYKEVVHNVHHSMAKTGIWLAPLIAIFVGALFVRRRFWLSLLLPVVMSPLFFAVLYKAFSISYSLNATPYADAVGDFTTAAAANQFYSYCVSLASTGFMIGVVLGIPLWLLTRTRELP